MKKLRLVLPLVGMAAITTLYLMKPTHEASSSSSIMLENVEALASGESPQRVIECAGIGNVYCPVNGHRVQYIFSSLKL